MDRTAFAACAGILLPLGVAVGAACDAAETQRAPAALATAQRAERTLAGATTRAPDLVAAGRRADARVRTGFDRAARGAYYSARAEFVAALRIVARAGDQRHNTSQYTRALECGLAALRESADFEPRTSGQPADSVERIIAGHQTSLLRNRPVDDLTTTAVAQQYCDYAAGQLAAATADETSGSMALFGLAKVAIASACSQPQRSPWETMQAMALYRAALDAHGNNFCAAHELGVLLAETGRLEQARDLLIRSVSISPQAVTWSSLARVHARLGESELAKQAQARADALPGRPASHLGPDVQWVDAQQFAGSSSTSDWQVSPRTMTELTPSTAVPAASRSSANAAKQRSNESFPWKSRR